MALKDIESMALNTRGFFYKQADFTQDPLGCHIFLSKEESDHLRVRQKQNRNLLSNHILNLINFPL